jgi:hypothetical protein
VEASVPVQIYDPGGLEASELVGEEDSSWLTRRIFCNIVKRKVLMWNSVFRKENFCVCDVEMEHSKILFDNIALQRMYVCKDILGANQEVEKNVVLPFETSVREAEHGVQVNTTSKVGERLSDIGSDLVRYKCNVEVVVRQCLFIDFILGWSDIVQFIFDLCVEMWRGCKTNVLKQSEGVFPVTEVQVLTRDLVGVQPALVDLDLAEIEMELTRDLASIWGSDVDLIDNSYERSGDVSSGMDNDFQYTQHDSSDMADIPTCVSLNTVWKLAQGPEGLEYVTCDCIRCISKIVTQVGCMHARDTRARTLAKKALLRVVPELEERRIFDPGGCAWAR